VTRDVDAIGDAQREGAAFLAQIAIVDHVSATFTNDTGSGNLCPASTNCSGTTMSSSGVNSNNLDFVSVDPASPAFVGNAAATPGGPCSCAFSGTCDGGCTISTDPVYQDAFVAFVRANYGGTAAPPVFFGLDNEPNYWGFTHPELWPFTGSVPCQDFVVTYDDIVDRDQAYAAAVKDAWPATKVFGPVVAQDGIIYAHSYRNDPHAGVEFDDYYLQQMAAASAKAGTPLLDAFDLHYYNGQTTDPSQCVQNPRMFWDPAYTDISPAVTDGIDFAWSGFNDYFDTNWYPRMLIPRLQAKIAAAFASAAPGVALSEYNSGCETSIGGGVAEADNLGIFGREGVFAAAAMPFAGTTNNYLIAAFDLYRNYDGNGGTVGDTAVHALAADVGSTSVYAFAHSGDASKLEVVVINKATQPASVPVSIAHAPSLTSATAYVLADGNPTVLPAAGPAPVVACASGACSFSYAMPAMSATTIVLR
jgi:hypothetical protein